MWKIAEKFLVTHCSEYPVIIKKKIFVHSQKMTCFIDLLITFFTVISIVDGEKKGKFLKIE